MKRYFLGSFFLISLISGHSLINALEINPKVLGYSDEFKVWLYENDAVTVKRKLKGIKSPHEEKSKGERKPYELYPYQKMTYDQNSPKKSRLPLPFDPEKLDLPTGKKSILSLLLNSYAEEPDNLGIMMEIANLLFTQNYPTQSIWWNKKALETDPNYSKALWNLGVIYSNIKDIPSASQYFNRYLQGEQQGYFATKAREYLITHKSFDPGTKIKKREMVRPEAAPAIITTWESSGPGSGGRSSGKAYLEIQGEILDPKELFPQEGDLDLNDIQAIKDSKGLSGSY